MLYKKFREESLSRLGFGTMRLPLLENGEIDSEKTQKMVDMAIEKGVNYFDTAYPYCQGKSEIVVGQALKKYPRDKFYLADKYPGHQIAQKYDPADIFEKQLKKCQVEYFDFYLLHNVCEQSIGVYEDEKWNIIPYFIEQKKLGRIKYLGFSSHANYDTLKYFVEKYKGEIDFCQIQLNYLDWSLQKAKDKYEMLKENNIPVWVIEPLRGGKLVTLSNEQSDLLKQVGFKNNQTAAFEFLKNLDNVMMILSGMSEVEQMQENIEIFSSENKLSQDQLDALFKVAEQLKKGQPCTGCRYCCEGCPMGLDIPQLINCYNDLSYSKSFTPIMYLEHLSEDKLPSACIGCGQCAAICPQKIDIPTVLQELSDMYNNSEKWKDICKQREEAAKAIKI